MAQMTSSYEGSSVELSGFKTTLSENTVPLQDLSLIEKKCAPKNEGTQATKPTFFHDPLSLSFEEDLAGSCTENGNKNDDELCVEEAKPKIMITNSREQKLPTEHTVGKQKQGWCCPSCTFLNPNDVRACVMCDTETEALPQEQTASLPPVMSATSTTTSAITSIEVGTSIKKQEHTHTSQKAQGLPQATTAAKGIRKAKRKSKAKTTQSPPVLQTKQHKSPEENVRDCGDDAFVPSAASTVQSDRNDFATDEMEESPPPSFAPILFGSTQSEPLLIDSCTQQDVPSSQQEILEENCVITEEASQPASSCTHVNEKKDDVIVHSSYPDDFEYDSTPPTKNASGKSSDKVSKAQRGFLLFAQNRKRGGDLPKGETPLAARLKAIETNLEKSRNPPSPKVRINRLAKQTPTQKTAQSVSRPKKGKAQITAVVGDENDGWLAVTPKSHRKVSAARKAARRRTRMPSSSEDDDDEEEKEEEEEEGEENDTGEREDDEGDKQKKVKAKSDDKEKRKGSHSTERSLPSGTAQSRRKKEKDLSATRRGENDSNSSLVGKKKACSQSKQARKKKDLHESEEEDDTNSDASPHKTSQKKDPPNSPKPRKGSPRESMSLPSEAKGEYEWARIQQAMLQEQQDEPSVGITAKNPAFLFRGLQFVLSGLGRKGDKENQERDDRLQKQVENLITRQGGSLLCAFHQTTLGAQKKRRAPYASFPQTLLLASSSHRTLKYLLALASATPIVHYNWLIHSHEQQCLLPYRPYLLPAGPKKGGVPLYLAAHKAVFDELRIEVVGPVEWKDLWRTVLKEGGAKVVERLYTPQEHRIEYIVSEPEPSDYLIRKFKELDVPVVSSEWVIQSLFSQKLLDPILYDYQRTGQDNNNKKFMK